MKQLGTRYIAHTHTASSGNEHMKWPKISQGEASQRVLEVFQDHSRPHKLRWRCIAVSTRQAQQQFSSKMIIGPWVRYIAREI